MLGLLKMHEFAALRGEGLRPEFLRLTAAARTPSVAGGKDTARQALRSELRSVAVLPATPKAGNVLSHRTPKRSLSR